MPEPNCFRKRATNYEETCTEEEKGELIAKLGQVIDQRDQNLAVLFWGTYCSILKRIYREAAILLAEPKEKRVCQLYHLALQNYCSSKQTKRS